MAVSETQGHHVIRAAKREDLNRILEFVYGAKNNLFKATYGDQEWQRLYALEAILGERLEELIERRAILLGFAEGEFAALVLLIERDLERFRHVGDLVFSIKREELLDTLGKELLSRMILQCKAKGVIRKVGIKVREDLDGKKEVFKNLGFYEEGVLHRDVCINGMFFSTILFGRSID